MVVLMVEVMYAFVMFDIYIHFLQVCSPGTLPSCALL